MKIFSHVNNGELSDYAQLQFLAELSHHDGKDVCITIERKRKKRSLNQNHFYWGVVIPHVRYILESYGNEVDDDETHSFLKQHVGKLRTSVIGGKGNRLDVLKSSAQLTTAEFEEYILKVRAWSATEGVQIPEPNEHLTGGDYVSD